MTKGKDLDLWHIKCQDSRAKLADLEVRKEDWAVTFEHSRKITTHLLTDYQQWNRKLKQQTKTLHTLCENESNTTAVHQKRNYLIKDLVDELYKRDVDAAEKLEQFEQLANTACETVTISSEEYNSAASLHAMTYAHKQSQKQTGINVKTEDPSSTAMDVEGENGNELDKKAMSKQLHSTFQQIADAIQRNEKSEGDLDWFFQDQDDLTPLEALLLKDYVKNAPDLIHIKSESDSASSSSDFMMNSEEKEAISKAFMSLCELGQEDKLSEYFNKVFDTLDGTGSASTQTRKKKQQRTDTISLSSFARSRTEVELPLIISPLSCLEDRYMGTLRYGTIFTPPISTATTAAPFSNPEKEFYIQSVIPQHIRQAENDVIARCAMQSCAAAAGQKMKKLQAFVQELTKQVAEGQVALQKSTWAFQVASNEDLNERNKMKTTLIANGFLPPDPNSTETIVPSFVPPSPVETDVPVTQELLTIETSVPTTSSNGTSNNKNNKNSKGRVSSGGQPVQNSLENVETETTTSESLAATEESNGNGKKVEDPATTAATTNSKNNKRKSGSLEPVAPVTAAASTNNNNTSQPANKRRR